MRRLVAFALFSALVLAGGAGATHDPLLGTWKVTVDDGGQISGVVLRISSSGSLYQIHADSSWRGKLGCNVPKGTLLWSWKSLGGNRFQYAGRYTSTQHCPHDAITGGALTVEVSADGQLTATCEGLNILCLFATRLTLDDHTGSGGAKADTKAPVIKALPGKAKVGKRTKLRYRAYDDSRGQVDTSISLYKGSKLLSTTGFTGLRNAIKGKVYLVTFTPSALFAGSLRFCVQGKDRAGNTSKPSCAKLTVSK